MMLNEQRADEFWQFIYDRHLIWYKRYILKQNPPWTNDDIFLNFKFTNVYRMLDRGSLYLHNEILSKIQDDNTKFLLIVFHRFYNKIETLESIKPAFNILNDNNTPEVIDYLQHLLYDQEQKMGLFTNAHMVNSIKSWKVDDYPGIPYYAKDSKSNRFMKGFLETHKNRESYVNKLRNTNTGKEAFDIIKGCAPGIGDFVAYEIFCDLIYTSILKQFDEDSFVNIGPGCSYALDIISPGPSSNTYDKYINILNHLFEHQFDYYNKNTIGFPYITFQYLQLPYLTKRCIEHSLCEFYKYFKTKNLIGTGRPRNGYQATINNKEYLGKSTDSYLKLLNSEITKDIRVNIVSQPFEFGPV